MATPGDLITELAAAGRLDSEGEFTLDPVKAREKVRSYLLASPAAYLAELLQAAVLLGASRVEVTLDADDARLAFDGEALTRPELEGLFTALFAADRGRRTRALQQLALGLNGAMHLAPAFARVASGRGGSALRLELRPGHPDRLEALRTRAGGSSIHVRKALRPGLLLAALRNLAGDLPEAAELRRRARFSRVPVLLDGERISSGLEAPELTAPVPVAGPQLEGVAGWDLTTSGVRHDVTLLLADGILVTTLREPAGPMGLRAVIDTSGLRKNVAQTDFVRDQAFAAIAPALAAARRAATAALARALEEPGAAARLPLERVLRGLRHEILRRTWPDGLPAELEAARAWPTAAGALRPVALARLRELAAEEQLLPFARTAHAGLASEELPKLVVWPADYDIEALARLVGAPAKDLSRTLASIVKGERNRDRWRQDTATAALGGGRWAARTPIAGAAATGELGVTHPAVPDCGFTYLRDGGTLHVERRDLGLPGVEIVIEAPFSPYKRFDGVRKDAVLAGALLEVLGAARRLVVAVAAGPAQSRLLGRRWYAFVEAWLELLADADAPRRFLMAAGFRPAAVDHHLAPLLAARPWRRVDLGPGAPASVLGLPLFQTVAGSPRTLAELHRECAERGRLRWAWAEEGLGRMEGDELLLTPRQALLLAAAVGGDRLDDAGRELQRRRHRAAHLARPPDPGRWSGRSLLEHRSEVEGARVVLQLLEPAPGPEGEALPARGHARVRALVDGRAVTELDLPAPVWPLWAVVEHPAVVPTPTWDGLEAGVEELAAAVAAAVPGLVGAAAEVLRRPRGAPSGLRPMLLLLAAERADRAPDALDRRLAQLPLVPLVGGRHASVDALRAAAGNDDRLRWVAADPRRELPPEVRAAPVVCAAEETTLTALRRLLGRELLWDWTDELEALLLDWSARRRPALERIALEPGSASVVVPLELDGAEGEVGVPAVWPGEALLILCRQRRRVGTLRRTWVPPVLAIADDPRLTLSGDVHGVVLDERVAAVAAAVEAAVPRLADALAAAWAGLPEHQRATAWRWALALLAATAHGAGGDTAAAPTQLAALLALPALRGHDGRRLSLIELQRASAPTGEIRLLSWAWPGEAPPGPPPIVAAAWERAELERLFPRAVDFDAAWHAAERARRRRAAAPALQRPRREEVLVEAAVDGAGLAGVLFLPRTWRAGLRVAFGADGVVVEERPLEGPLPCCGVVWGDGLEADWAAGRVELAAGGAAVLRGAAVALYRRLAETPQLAAEPVARALLAAARLDLERLRTGAGLDEELGGLLRQLGGPAPEPGAASSPAPRARRRPGAPVPPVRVPPPTAPPAPTPPRAAAPPPPAEVLAGHLARALARLQDRLPEAELPLFARTALAPGDGRLPLTLEGDVLRLDPEHPLVARALARPDDRTALVLLTAALGARGALTTPARRALLVMLAGALAGTSVGDEHAG